MDEFRARRRKDYKRLAIGSISVATVAFVIYALAHGRLFYAVAASLIPLMILILVESFARKQFAFLMLFIVNYFIAVIPHYLYNFPSGMLMDLMILFDILVICSNALVRNVSAKKVNWGVLAVLGVWLLFCFLEVFNPRMLDLKAWMSGMRSLALYFFMVYLIVQLTTENLKDIKDIILVLSFLVIIATIKVLYQRYVGFTSGDKYFLNVLDGRRTHIIYYGIRYFSIFSDAANFGGSMGLCFVLYAIVGLHTRKISLKIYWWFIAVLALYGTFISGTRSALVIPVAGVMVYLLLIRDFKKMVPVGIALGVVIYFLACTSIGNSSSTIRRARTVFHRNEDASYLIRLDNRAKLRTILADMPFGNSLGMSGGRGRKYGDKSEASEIPTDSWYVQVWVETGIVGASIYFAIMAFLFIYGGYLVMFKIKNEELKGYTAGMLSGVIGLFAMSSNNEVFSQFPNGIIVYTFIALIFMSPKIDRTLQIEKTDDRPKTPDFADNGGLQRAGTDLRPAGIPETERS